MINPDIWLIEIRPLADRPGEPPAARRIAQWLKLGLRAFRLECVSFTDVAQRSNDVPVLTSEGGGR